ncbi:type I restriction enzyme, S subunit [Staphylococcus warneri]
MTNEQKNIPELRFPEFDGEWEEKKFGEFTKTNQGLQIAISDRKTEFSPELYFYITNEFLKPNSKTHYYISNPPDSVIANENDILMTRTGNTGKVITGVKGAFHNNFFKIQFDQSEYNRLFLFEVLNSPKIKNKILSLAGTSTIPDLNHSDFYSISSYYPIINEQQKIGDFFSKLDRQIELEEQKLEKLKEQKKGYMQQIFSRQFLFENEKGDTDYSWRNFKINDIFSKIESGNRLPKTNLVEGNIPYVIAQTTNNGVFMHISEDTLDYHKNKLKLFKKGSITISIDNPEAMFIQEMDFFTSNVMRVIHNENLKRGSHIFIMESLKKLTQSYNWSVKFSGPIIMDSTVKFPVYNDNKVNWNVVNKIGDFFNTFEIRINRQSDKIKLLEERKKGFLQKMFV